MEYDAWKMGFDAFNADSGLNANPFRGRAPRFQSDVLSAKLIYSWEGGWRAAAMRLAQREDVAFTPNGYYVQ